MNSLLRTLTKFSEVFKQLGICATVGFIAGTISGFFLLLLFLSNGDVNLSLSFKQLLPVVILLMLFDMSVLLFLLVGLCRLRFESIFLPTLINCLLTCLVTTLLVNGFNLWLWSIIVGMVVGLIIGRLLCILFCRLQGDNKHVVH